MNKFSTGLRQASPTILTVLGIVGVVGTAVTAVRATPKAMRLIKAKKDELLQKFKDILDVAKGGVTG